MDFTQCLSFFDKQFKTPKFIVNKQQTAQSRRVFLKSAAGMGVLTSLPAFSLSKTAQTSLDAQVNNAIKTDPWLTLDATLNQLLPESETGPSALDIAAITYLYGIMTVQPTEQDEKDFILKGVGWLNGYANSEKSKNFVLLSFDDKEQLLRGISKSRAGQNWLNTLLNYILQAMLTPPSYGGNPNGIGWQWLEHQPGLPLPEQGQRYFELPNRARIDLISRVDYTHKRKVANVNQAAQGTRKA
ncbi:gluconate 2-dehydrogenase subunit 3 family protein [Colwellia echini]|uniref:Gluconate 2-dehydrogenase subunit 3 family protein n=1 Tax=Colwellia echini TaxID=1982103 RepID=A0ABY3MUU0_9GAMM|nr:gluconate 2-dehydrogenase subunit 3 family protein [Colwellia echini]TYK64978.1 gluconate 2-dehydrogenase subunit 3 family protein [Colwellia echini]